MEIPRIGDRNPFVAPGHYGRREVSDLVPFEGKEQHETLNEIDAPSVSLVITVQR